MRRAKLVVLGLLAVLSFGSPFMEAVVTGQVETFSSFGLLETGASLILLFTWYHLDKREHDYPAGRLMNAAMLAAAVVALPIYLLRSRGWRRGTIAIGIAALYLALTFGLGELGELLGTKLGR
jgi:peptidoglycan/LPS O-acetylase OafA/YrhL